jgi:hypothetical protein
VVAFLLLPEVGVQQVAENGCSGKPHEPGWWRKSIVVFNVGLILEAPKRVLPTGML